MAWPTTDTSSSGSGLADGDVRRCTGEEPVTTKKGRCKVRHVTAILNKINEMNSARTEVIVCTGLRTQGGQQL